MLAGDLTISGSAIGSDDDGDLGDRIEVANAHGQTFNLPFDCIIRHAWLAKRLERSKPPVSLDNNEFVVFANGQQWLAREKAAQGNALSNINRFIVREKKLHQLSW